MVVMSHGAAESRNISSVVEAWIDVGGTFTDCFVRQSGEMASCKVLSSGRLPLEVDSIVAHPFGGFDLRSPQLASDVSGFWRGARLLCLDSNGEAIQRSSIVESQPGRIQCSSDLPEQAYAKELRFEIHTDFEAPVLAVHRLLGIPLSQGLPAIQVRLGTTKGTNALLTRTGATTALAVTSPFEDLLEIGDQTRPDLFKLAVQKPSQLAHHVVGIHERLDAGGQVLLELDVDQARAQLLSAKHAGCESLAISLMHSYLNPAHEQQLLRVAEEVGFAHVSVSSALAPQIEYVARTQTTVVDAYLSPIIRSYLQLLRRQFEGSDNSSSSDQKCRLQVMTSAGGLIDWDEYRGKDSILSGPAGGVAALASMAESLGYEQLIGLDMGGTSTDVCRVGQQIDLQFESTKASVKILTPTLPIETVASGGGSVCWFDGVSLRVGPQSAGSAPGPACYGRGGPLTITDVNLFLGRIPRKQFPFPLDEVAVVRRLEELVRVSTEALGNLSTQELASGFRTLANEQMAGAVRTVSIAQGTDPRQHALVGFGGAAGQHICDIARLLDVFEIIDSPHAGLLSALGMGLAKERRDGTVPVYKLLHEVPWREVEKSVQENVAALQDLWQHQGDNVVPLVTQLAELRYSGTDSSLTLPWVQPLANLRQSFHSEHQRRYGYARDKHPIELVAVRVVLERQSPHSSMVWSQEEKSSQQSAPTILEVSTSLDERLAYREIRRSDLKAGMQFAGPAIVLNPGSTLVVERDWSGFVLNNGALKLTHGVGEANKSSQIAKSHEEFDPVFRDCFAQRMSAIATQMGLVLQQTAVSVNVKQRRDYSCAIFDHRGSLLANAPHVPVHLGAMGDTVRAVIEAFPTMRPGDAFITNDPYRGGSHLPDITVVTPVFSPGSGVPAMFVANRAHHADVGGLSPGSMSVAATKLGEEGVILAPRKLIDSGRSCMQELEEHLRRSAYPPRDIAQNLADLAAQLAGNQRGASLLEDYASQVTWQSIANYSKHLLDAAESRTRNFLRGKAGFRSHFKDFLDDGTPIAVALEIHADGNLRVDFSGTGPVNPGNFNANRSIVSAAVLYVLRCMIDDSLPLNEGVFRCIEMHVPEGILNPPALPERAACAAVSAGNVETSQRIVDVLLGAFGDAAASQGTMNNVLFGNARFGFYETICGGAGACHGFDGASAVHTHMTNTRLTDPEVLEANYPVRLREFRVRRSRNGEHSGGAGRWAGGDGIVRAFEFLESVDVSLLTSRRGNVQPYGMAGGLPGQAGQNCLVRKFGAREELPACAQLTVKAGDVLEISTPGGGGFGKPTCMDNPPELKEI